MYRDLRIGQDDYHACEVSFIEVEESNQEVDDSTQLDTSDRLLIESLEDETLWDPIVLEDEYVLSGDETLLAKSAFSRLDILSGAGGSVFIHLLIFVLIIVWQICAPVKSLDFPTVTITLVNLEPPGAGEETGGGAESGSGGSPQSAPELESSSPAALEDPVISAEHDEPKPVAAPSPTAMPERVPPAKAKSAKPPTRLRSVSRARPASNTESPQPLTTGKSMKEDGPATESNSNGTGIKGTGERVGGGPGDVPSEFNSAQLDKQPQIILKTEPVYPYSARRQNICGTVTVRFLVDPSGNVKRPSILKATPSGVFEKSVLEAISQWRFKPGQYRGRAVSTWMVLPIHFKLS